jgi:hypothetical protein
LVAAALAAAVTQHIFLAMAAVVAQAQMDLAEMAEPEFHQISLVLQHNLAAAAHQWVLLQTQFMELRQAAAEFLLLTIQIQKATQLSILVVAVVEIMASPAVGQVVLVL